MVPDCYACRVAARAAIADEPKCGVPQPHSGRTCERAPGQHEEHRASLTPGRTYCYWTDGRVVNYREVHPGWVSAS